MKKTCLIVALCLMIALPCLAQVTGVQVDGKHYAIYGADGVYKADGKTFVIQGGFVTVQEAGKPDKVLKLYAGVDASIAKDDADIAIACEAVTVANRATATSDAPLEPASLDAYGRFGLRYDQAGEALYFKGQRVRVFEDQYPLDDNVATVLAHFDPLGTVDVEAVRDASTYAMGAGGSHDPSGALIGLRALTARQFADRDLSRWTDPRPVEASMADGNAPMTDEEKRAFFAPYEAFGLAYDLKTNQLTYQGQLVRSFLDIRKTNGQPLSGGNFVGSMTQLVNDQGVVDVTTVRDYERVDANGEGTLIGVRVN